MVMKRLIDAIVRQWKTRPGAPPSMEGLHKLVVRHFLPTQCRIKRVSSKSVIIYHFNSVALHLVYGNSIVHESLEPWAVRETEYLDCIGLMSTTGEFTVFYNTRHLTLNQAVEIGAYISQLYDSFEVGQFVNWRQ